MARHDAKGPVNRLRVFPWSNRVGVAILPGPVEKDVGGGGAHPGGRLSLQLQAAALARSRARAAGRRRASGEADREARIEVLGDRIEMLEFTLNEYVERLDGLATHSARLSVDRLEPVVDRLARAIAGSAPSGTPPSDGEPGPMQRGSQAGDSAVCLPDEIAAIDSRLAAMETMIAALAERHGADAPPASPPPGTARGALGRLLDAVGTLGRRQDQAFEAMEGRLSAIEAALAAGASAPPEGAAPPASAAARLARLESRLGAVTRRRGMAEGAAATRAACCSGDDITPALGRIEATVEALRRDVEALPRTGKDPREIRRAAAMGTALAELLADARQRAASLPRPVQGSEPPGKSGEC